MSKARGLADLGNVNTRLDEVGNTDGALSNRNVLINSSFGVAQRGTSFTSSAFVVDRWYVNSKAAGTTHSRQEFALGQTDVEGSPTYFLRMGVNGDTSRQLYQKVEDIRQFENKTYTYSFWAKANATLTPTVRAAALYDGSAVEVLDSQAISVGTSWAKYEVTLTIGSFAGKTIGAASALQFDFTFFDDSVYEFDLAQPQIEVGDTATPFEHRSYGQELALCQRYFNMVIDYDNDGGTAIRGIAFTENDGGTRTSPLAFPVTMRTIPTMSQVGTSYRFYAFGSASTTITTGVNSFAPTSNQVVLTFSTGLSNQVVTYWRPYAAGVQVLADAEL